MKFTNTLYFIIIKVIFIPDMRQHEVKYVIQEN
jgi:hypothetical protein